MRRILIIVLILVSVIAVCITACKRTSVTIPEVTAVGTSNFPSSIGKIFINKCAIAGCHNAASAQNSDGLLLDTWEHLFNGGYDGASVVPYSTEFSPMLYYINAYDSADVIAQPLMPVSTTSNPLPPLTLAEYDTIKNWIARGAPDSNGNIAFSSNPVTRQKMYLTQSGCNQLAVIDAKTKLVMRYIPVGNTTIDQAQHDVTISSDGRYAYVSFYVGNLLEKIDCNTDTVVGSVDLSPVLPFGIEGSGQWSIVTLSPDNSILLVSAFIPNGCVIAVNTATMQINNNLSIGESQGLLGDSYPHGLASNAAFDTFYACLEYGNEVLKWWFVSGAPHFKVVTLNSNPPTTTSIKGVTPDPHIVVMSPDYSKYFVTCENTGEVRVMDAATDTLIKAIPVGVWPQELSISRSRNYLFAVCMEDSVNNTNPGSIGSVFVIDINTLEVVKILTGYFYQPHDIAVDEQDGLVFLASTNINPGGPPPHHVTACTGRPGWYTVYNLNTLQPADANQYTVLVNPYAISNRY